MSRSAKLETRRADEAGRRSIRQRRRPNVTPFGIVLLFGAVASAAFLGWAIMIHDAPLAVLGAALVSLGTIYLLIAAFAAVLTYRAGSDGRGGRSVLYALVGGVAAIVAFVAYAFGYIVLFQ